ncbi:MAG: hypothetical protein NT145_07820 [Elusimicrobia bacterium]|nr:hypothetical protein [Elusimicrobiota bacterium]
MMKKILLLFVMMVIIPSLIFGEVEQRLEEDSHVFYQNGKRMFSIKVTQENFFEPVADSRIPDGILKRYGGDGSLTECSYKNGKANGLSKSYYKDGKVCGTCYYKNGLGNGVSTVYNEDGSIQCSAIYKNGKLISMKSYK